MDAQLQQLEAHTASGNVEGGMAVLQQIKLARLTGTTPVNDAQYAAALECGVFLAVKSEDLDLFARHMQQLQPLYATVNTPRKNHVTGLNLMALLVNSSSSEFHSELELLTKEQEGDAFLQFPIAVDRKLMVGIFDEVLQMSLPDPSYQFFMDQLNSTVRDAIADCMEVSYEQLSLKEAAEIMKFDGVGDDLKDYIESVREDWIVEGDTITFQVQQGAAVTAQDIPSKQWIQQSLTYATEMERIV